MEHRKTPQEVIDGLCEHLRPLYDLAVAQGIRVVEAQEGYGYAVRLERGPTTPAGRTPTALGPVVHESLPMQTYGYTRAYTCTEHGQQLGYDLDRRRLPVEPDRRGSALYAAGLVAAVAAVVVVVLLAVT